MKQCRKIAVGAVASAVAMAALQWPPLTRTPVRALVRRAAAPIRSRSMRGMGSHHDARQAASADQRHNL